MQRGGKSTAMSFMAVSVSSDSNSHAVLRRPVKRLLRKHGYPPDNQKTATRTAREQTEDFSAGWAPCNAVVGMDAATVPGCGAHLGAHSCSHFVLNGRQLREIDEQADSRYGTLALIQERIQNGHKGP